MNHLFERDFTDDILLEICSRYGLLSENASLIKEDSNLIYDCGDSILRISHSAIRGREVILKELEWMQYLLSKEVSVVGIIPSQGGHLLESVEGASCYFTAVLFVKRDLFLIGYVNSIWRQGVMTEPRLNLIDSMEASVAVRRQRLGW